MDRASKAIRRSGVRLKSLSGGHSDLNMIISELSDVRQAAKSFMSAQNSVAQDMVKWATSSDNRAIQDIMELLAELNQLWTEVQREFLDNLKDFKYQFKMISDFEREIAHARNHLAACEQRELRIRKDLKRAAKKYTMEEIDNLEIKLTQAERAKDLAQLEVMEKLQENEATKLIRLKDGLIKLSDSYVEMASKCIILFEAQKDVSYQLPDVPEVLGLGDAYDIKYTGSGMAKHSVLKARDKVHGFKRHKYQLLPTTPAIDDPPPPYTPGFYDPASGEPFPVEGNEDYPHHHQPGSATTQQRQRAVGPDPACPPSCPPYPSSDVRWGEDDLSQAMGAAKI